MYTEIEHDNDVINAYEEGYEQGRKDVIEELESFLRGYHFTDFIAEIASDDESNINKLIELLVRVLE